VRNCKLLKQAGCILSTDEQGNPVPIEGISGMKTDQCGIMMPWEVFPVKEKKDLGMLIWGSPHPCTSSNNGHVWNGTAYYNHTPKTEAFETMTWMIDGVIVITFSSQYLCELYQPKWHDDSANRHMIVASAYMRTYMPMRSSNIKIDTISFKEDVKVAMATPYKYINATTWTSDGRLNFSTTMKSLLKMIKHDKKYEVALGVYAANLEAELVS
jgi:hypothetical protein